MEDFWRGIVLSNRSFLFLRARGDQGRNATIEKKEKNIAKK